MFLRTVVLPCPVGPETMVRPDRSVKELTRFCCSGVKPREANVGAPQVAYKETFTKEVNVDSKYAKQSGGRGQYGHCKVIFTPMDPNGEETFRQELSVRDAPIIPLKLGEAAFGLREDALKDTANERLSFFAVQRFIFLEKAHAPEVDLGIRPHIGDVNIGNLFLESPVQQVHDIGFDPWTLPIPVAGELAVPDAEFLLEFRRGIPFAGHNERAGLLGVAGKQIVKYGIPLELCGSMKPVEPAQPTGQGFRNNGYVVHVYNQGSGELLTITLSREMEDTVPKPGTVSPTLTV